MLISFCFDRRVDLPRCAAPLRPARQDETKRCEPILAVNRPDMGLNE
jgi:hypothetical protein